MIKNNKIFFLVLMLVFGLSAGATDTEVLDSRCNDIREKARNRQITVQKEESASAAEMITGGNVIDSKCLNSFDISLSGLGFSLPNIDNLLDGFLNQLCNKANSAISSNIDTINRGLDLPIGAININSNHDGEAISTEQGQDFMDSINKTIPDIPIINKEYRITGGGENDYFYQ